MISYKLIHTIPSGFFVAQSSEQQGLVLAYCYACELKKFKAIFIDKLVVCQSSIQIY